MRVTWIGGFLGLAALLGPLCPSPTGAQATFTAIGDLPGGESFSTPSAVSADGITVVGYSRSVAEGSSYEAFRWTAAEGMVGLGDLGTGNPRSFAFEVSADGAVIVGRASTGAFRWTSATGLVQLEDPTGALDRGQAFGVSADGAVIVGVADTMLVNQAFRWTEPTGMVGLGWLPADFKDSFATAVSADGSVICGFSISGAFNNELFRWTQAGGMVGLGDVPGGIHYALAWDISADGSTIVGPARTSFGTRDEFFLWTEASGFILPDPLHGETFGSVGEAVSADGSIAVGSGENGAMIWDAANGMRSLQDLLASAFGLDLTGWTLFTATGISDDGTTIVGNGLNPSGDTEAWIVQLPSAAAGVTTDLPRTGLQLTSFGPTPFVSDVEFGLLVPADAGHVRAGIYGVDGRLVRMLADESLDAGTYTLRWAGRDRKGRATPASVYFLRVSAGNETVARKIVRLR